MSKSDTSILLLPLVALRHLVGLVFNLTGRFIAVTLGIVLMLVGGILIATVIGAVVGIPIFAFGLLLAARGLF